MQNCNRASRRHPELTTEMNPAACSPITTAGRMTPSKTFVPQAQRSRRRQRSLLDKGEGNREDNTLICDTDSYKQGQTLAIGVEGRVNENAMSWSPTTGKLNTSEA